MENNDIKKIHKKIAATKDGHYHYWLMPVGKKFKILMLESGIIPTRGIPEAENMVEMDIFNNEEEAIKALLKKHPEITIL
jgi:hypothetical protein